MEEYNLDLYKKKRLFVSIYIHEPITVGTSILLTIRFQVVYKIYLLDFAIAAKWHNFILKKNKTIFLYRGLSNPSILKTKLLMCSWLMIIFWSIEVVADNRYERQIYVLILIHGN